MDGKPETEIIAGVWGSTPEGIADCAKRIVRDMDQLLNGYGKL
jgi:hypothetical protein